MQALIAFFGGIRTLTDDELDFPMLQFVKIFGDEERGFPLSVTVLRYGSPYRLLSFVVDMLNQVGRSQFRSHQRQGAFSQLKMDTLACGIT